MHISLSRAGGAGLTSWYTGTTVKPVVPLIPKTATGILDLRRRPFVTVPVRSDGTVRTTGFRLRGGTAYKITAASVYGFGTPAQVADSSCRWWRGTRWVPNPTAADARSHGSLSLLVNRRAITTTCHASHVYSRIVKTQRTGRLRLQVANRRGGSGNLTVLVSRRSTDVRSGLPRPPVLTPAPATTAARNGSTLTSETVTVPASSGTVWSTGAVENGASYRVTVGGTGVLGAGVQTDGRCLDVAGAWYSQASLDRRFPALAHGRVYVDGTPFAGAATSGGPVCASRTHTMSWTAKRTGQVELSVWDPLTRTANTGALSVQLVRLPPVSTT